MYKEFTSLFFLGFCHKQMHVCPYEAHAWTNHHYRIQLAMALQKAELTASNQNHLFSLYYATTIPLGISTLKALKPTKSFSSPPCPQRIRDISFNKPRRMTNDFDYSKVRNATTLDAENSAD